TDRPPLLGAGPARIFVAAARADAELGIGVILLEHGRQIVDQALQLHLAAVNAGVALLAIPLEGVDFALAADALDDEADAARRPLRRVAHMGRQQEDVALAQGHVALLAVLLDAQERVALELVEELL